MITWKQSGQPRPYADHIYSGTITADSESDVRVELTAAIRDRIYNIDEAYPWHAPHFTQLKLVSPNTWEFIIERAYTG